MKDMKKLQTEEAEPVLRKLLKTNGFDPKKPSVKIGWETFKEMSKYLFDCSEDDLLFETGVYDFSDEELFYFSLIRQFTIDVDGEYDYMEQLHMEFTYRPEAELKALTETIWTYDFDDNFERFLEAVEQSEAFQIPQKKFEPVGFDLYYDEV